MVAALPLLLASCQQEELPDMNGASDATPLSITVTDAGYASTDKAATRAEELDGYATTFTEGDACGLYLVRDGRIIYDNVKLTATAGDDGAITWQPEEGVTLAGGLEDESYFLYYPYQSDLSAPSDLSDLSDDAAFFSRLIAAWEPAADQSDYADYTASDLMTAKGRIVRNGASKTVLSFHMTHRMALAVIELPKTVYKFKEAGIPYYVTSSAADFTGSPLKPCRMADGTYRCIVKPASAASLCGIYDNNGTKEFAITASAAQGSYKTYTIDGATPIEKQTTLQMGDYFCKNSDNYWYIIPQESTPDGNVIGIVFHAGQHNSDNADYSATGIGQANCHGYAVALTDAYNDDNDRLRWEYGPGNVSDLPVGTSTSTNDWSGYFNSQKIHEFVSSNTDWDMKYFPAALVCETYGNRTTDQDGNPANGKYDWQKPLAAPSNTSGWFLPSSGQLKYLYQNRSVLSPCMTAVKNYTPNDCSYKDKIRWFTTSWYYWSSTENSNSPSHAWIVSFYGGRSDYYKKSDIRVVRAVLAF